MLWHAHIDWLTTTWKPDAIQMGGSFATSMYTWALAHLGGSKADWPLEHWAWQGYVGWAVGGLSFGERLDSSIIRVSGALADSWWRDGRPIGHNVSRLDVCVDVWWNEEPDSIIARHNVETLDARMLTDKRPWKVACVNGYGDGDTLYLGSRSSELFGRIYNKEKESKDNATYKGCTRYEIEYKDAEANQVIRRVGSRRNDSGMLASEVHSVLTRRGINILGDILASGVVHTPAARIVTSDERKLDWLRTQVQPTVKSLLTRHDIGLILAALGLDV